MAKREEKREALKGRLIDVAETRIREHGLAALRAREIADDAGCALGAIYNAFADLDELILQVNTRTLRRLGELAAGSSTAEPRDRLKELALTYAAFASENTNLWAAVFDHRMSAGRPTPGWYLQEHAVLIEHIVRPVAALRPALELTELLVRARTLFSAVHGIVSVSIEGRFVGIAPASLRSELERFVDLIVTGMEGTPDG